MSRHKSEDYKISEVQYYLSKNNTKVANFKIFWDYKKSNTLVNKYNKYKNIKI